MYVCLTQDSGKKNSGKSKVDLNFDKALQEAEAAHKKLKFDREAREEEQRAGLVCIRARGVC